MFVRSQSKRTPTLGKASSMSTRPSPLEINEILQRVLSFMTQSALRSSVSLVCHHWRQVASGLIHYHLQLDDDPKTWKDYSEKLFRADELTLGRTIKASSQRPVDFDPTWVKSWKQRMAALLSLNLSADNIQDSIPEGKEDNTRSHSRSNSSHSNERELLIRTLNVNLENWWPKYQEILSHFNPRHLTELTMDMPSGVDSMVSLNWIFEKSPKLVRLAISAHKWIHLEMAALEPNPFLLDPKDQNQSGRQLPLKSLSLHNMNVLPNALLSYTPKLGNLIELSLLAIFDLPSGSEKDSFYYDETRLRFWSQLAKDCPNLVALNYNCYNERANDIPVECFPRLMSWGFDCRIRTMAPMLTRLMTHGVENRITTLVIVPGTLDRGYTRPSLDPERDRALHRFLCSSPLLLHFSTGQVPMSLAVLCDYGDLESIWQCRGLRTLSMRLDNNRRYQGFLASNRHIFGYLGRVCPRLQELSLSLDSHVLAPESGVCLLTRLKYLRKLSLATEYPEPYGEKAFNARDLAWIRGCDGSDVDVNESQTSGSPLSPSSLLRSTVMGSWWKRDRGGHHVCDDYRYCLDRIREKSDLSHLSQTDAVLDRQRTQQENLYLSDYDRPLPMVDGLEDFEFCGSFLEIEAFYQARLFHLEQEHQERNNRQDLTQQQPSSTRRMTQPWPHLEHLTFMYGWCVSRRNKEAQKELLGVQQILKQLRPDIEVSCQFSEKALY
ncbi:hypothetical protein EMPS_03184 [Entomortierella parvispora]|uniref:F-box domain-containing protein n=1 Tax=Entomortierella parvispora TaxID=205924 RepID=A0A9P3H696_9FUNG|nr:hypothetical protein EMPS_03184 [Entomortierella parvispora]